MNPKFKIGIVEDEAFIAGSLELSLLSEGYDVCPVAASYEEAVQLQQEHQPDIYILDINILGEKSGLDFADYLNSNTSTPFIILTSYSDRGTINKAKWVNPHAYLVKPFKKEELVASIELALFNHKRFNQQEKIDKLNVLNNCVFYKNKDKFVKLPLSDIVFFKSDHVYVDIFMRDKSKHTIRNSMSALLESIKDVHFYQVHRSYIINLNFIDYINSTDVSVHGELIPISKSYKDDLLNRIQMI